MGKRPSNRENELYKRCDEVLHYLWDPIGVAGYPTARDEYDSYLPQIFAMVRDEVPTKEIVEHLALVERVSMGMAPDRDRALEVVEALKSWRDEIWASLKD